MADESLITKAHLREALSHTDQRLNELEESAEATVQKYIYTATIGTTWVGSAAPYTQAVSVPGILATDEEGAMVHVSPVYTDTHATNVEIIEAWGLVSIARVTADDEITFECFNSAPTVDIPIQVGVER